MVSICLEDLEALNKKGVNEEIIRNTSSFVYAGGLRFVVIRSILDRLHRHVGHGPCRGRICKPITLTSYRQILHWVAFSLQWPGTRIS
jgi:hypothetical protein